MIDSIILYQLKAKSLLYLVFITKFAIRELQIMMSKWLNHRMVCVHKI